MDGTPQTLKPQFENSTFNPFTFDDLCYLASQTRSQRAPSTSVLHFIFTQIDQPTRRTFPLCVRANNPVLVRQSTLRGLQHARQPPKGIAGQPRKNYGCRLWRGLPGFSLRLSQGGPHCQARRHIAKTAATTFSDGALFSTPYHCGAGHLGGSRHRCPFHGGPTCQGNHGRRLPRYRRGRTALFHAIRFSEYRLAYDGIRRFSHFGNFRGNRYGLYRRKSFKGSNPALFRAAPPALPQRYRIDF